MDSDLIELLTQNLSRFDENSEVDRAGVYYVLGECSSFIESISALLICYLQRCTGELGLANFHR